MARHPRAIPHFRKLVAAFAAVGCIGLGVTALGGGTASAAATPAFPFPTHVTYKVGVMPSAPQATRDAAVEKQYDSWKATYLVHGCASNEYYVSTKGDDDATNGGTVSEAQGYGMNIVPLMAGYDPNAQSEFNGLWQLVQDHKDQWGLMQWQLDGKTCKYYSSGTPDAATDGDLDIGYGLILADKQWGGYTAAAKAWLASIYANDVAPDGHLKCEDDGPNTDTRPSDMMLDHLRAFAAYDTAHDWSKVITRTEAVVNEFTAKYSPSAGLLSDFVVDANTTSPQPAPADYQEDQPDNIVGYNSIRVPWHMGTDALENGATVAATAYNTAKLESACLKSLSGGKPADVQPHIKLNCANDNVSNDTQAEEAGDSAGPAAMAAGDQAWTDAIWAQLATNPFGDTYYGETIKTLVYIVMAGDYWNPAALPGSGPTSSPTPSASASASPTPSPTPSPTATGPAGGKSYEAESATLANGADANSCSACSGGKKVSAVGGSANGTVTFTGVTEPSSGSYQLTVYYLSVGKAKPATVTVNGTTQTVTFPETDASSYSVIGSYTVTVALKSGSNTVAFSASGTASAPDLDRIVV